jgi:alkylated DNA repair dioxygenase AlkB
MNPPPTFVAHDLGDGLHFWAGRVPEGLRWDAARFEAEWSLRPDDRPTIHLHGRPVQIPRWQQAYGRDYRFSGQVSAAAPVPPLLEPLLAWARAAIHPSLNGLLLNWYEGPGHYIGPHNDSTVGMAAGTPIVTVSFGEERKFRLSRGKSEAREAKDFAAPDGTVFVLPRDTNAAWKHSVPKSARYTGRRISVTVRGFE